MKAAIFLGAVNGLSLGLLAIGLVLIYKAARFVNFAHAQLGVLPAMLLGKACIDWGWSWWVAFPLAIALGAAIGAACDVFVVRPLRDRSRMTLLIATIGLSQLLLAFTYFTWMGPTRSKLVNDGYPLPFDVRITVDRRLDLVTQHLLVLVIVPVVAVGLIVLFRSTLLGKLIRAMASNTDAAGLAGVSVQRLSTITWAMAGALSAISAILAAPGQTSFDTQAMGPALLLRALGAAALGGFTSMPAAFGTGVGLGVIEAVAVFQARNQGVAEFLIFLTILAGLIIRSRTISRSVRLDNELVDVHSRPLRIPAVLRGRPLVTRTRPVLVAACVTFAVLAPMLPPWEAPSRQFLLALTLIFALVAVSLTVLAGWAGQVSLGQFAFVGVGAVVSARFMLRGWSLPSAMLAAGVVAAVFAVLIGIPALRLRGLSLAVTTLGFAVITPSWLLHQDWLRVRGVLSVPPPGMVGLGRLATQRSLYYTALLALLVACACAGALRRSLAGRTLLAVRDNETGATALGVAPVVVKLSVFALSGFMAGAAGALWTATQRNVAIDQFSAQVSLTCLAIVVIGGLGSLAGAVTGAVFFIGVPYLTASWFRGIFYDPLQFQLFAGGIGLIITQIANPGGLVEATKSAWERFLEKVARSVPDPADADPAPPALEVRDVRVNFGGVVALDGASISVDPGEIVGLIGTNGAGKTTLLDVVSGLVQPSAGSVAVYGKEVSHLGPEYRAHLGVARSFQDARLFPGLTVTEVVQMALARRSRVGLIAGLLGAPWARFAERGSRLQARQLVEAFGLGAWADTVAADLSTGTRRICDLAVQAAGGPSLLLLDEPTAGVAQRDAEVFGPLLRRVVQELGCAALVIEHDMPLMLSIADRIYCLEAGRVIAEGTPDEIRTDPRVVASYLGTDRAAIERSGTTDRRRRRRNGAPSTSADKPIVETTGSR